MACLGIALRKLDFCWATALLLLRCEGTYTVVLHSSLQITNCEYCTAYKTRYSGEVELSVTDATNLKKYCCDTAALAFRQPQQTTVPHPQQPAPNRSQSSLTKEKRAMALIRQQACQRKF